MTALTNIKNSSIKTSKKKSEDKINVNLTKGMFIRCSPQEFPKMARKSKIVENDATEQEGKL